MNRPARRLRAVALLVALAWQCSGSTANDEPVSIAVDWSAVRGEVPRRFFGLNIWNGMDPEVGADPDYRRGLRYLAPSLVRFHAQEQIRSGHAKSWLSDDGLGWNAERIDRALANTPDAASDVMVTISGWPPAYADPERPGRLHPSRIEEYAEFCAELVRIVNRDGGHQVRFWEPFNEKDKAYADDIDQLAAIFIETKRAMKAVDDSIEVGGGAWEQPGVDETIDPFLDIAGPHLDFLSYHNYGGTPSAEPRDYVTRMPSGIAWWAGELTGKLRRRGLDMPIWLDEYNLFYDYRFDLGDRLMASQLGAVFDALVLTELAESQTLDALVAWNDSDGVYGKLNDAGGRYAIRPAGRFFHLARRHLHGWFVSARSSSPERVKAFAVTRDGAFAVLLINRDTAAATGTLRLGGWNAPPTTVSRYRLVDGDTSLRDSTFAGATTNVALEPRELQLLVFDGAGAVPVGQQPYRNALTALPGTVQAEHYDNGGQHIAYLDHSLGNDGGAGRADQVDLYGDDSNAVVGNLETGEWLEYTFEAAAGRYDLHLTAASRWSGNAVDIDLDGRRIGSVPIPQTHDDGRFGIGTLEGIDMPSATDDRHTLRLTIDGFLDGKAIDGFTLDAFELGVATRRPSVADYLFLGATPSDARDDTGMPAAGYGMRVSADADDPGVIRLRAVEHYASHGFRYAAPRNDKRRWRSATMTLRLKNAAGFLLVIEDRWGNVQRLPLERYLLDDTADGWQRAAIPVDDYTAIDFGQLSRVHLYRWWKSEEPLTVADWRLRFAR